MSNKKIYIGMDVGVRFIGVAIGNSIIQSISPLCSLKYTINNNNFTKDTVIVLTKVLNDWEPNALVIGRPLNMDGTEFWMTKVTDKFSDYMINNFNFKIYRQDERLSTVEAKNRIFEKFGYRGLKKGTIDTYSAVIILEDFMRERKICY